MVMSFQLEEVNLYRELSSLEVEKVINLLNFVGDCYTDITDTVLYKISSLEKANLSKLDKIQLGSNLSIEAWDSLHSLIVNYKERNRLLFEVIPDLESLEEEEVKDLFPSLKKRVLEMNDISSLFRIGSFDGIFYFHNNYDHITIRFLKQLVENLKKDVSYSSQLEHLCNAIKRLAYISHIFFYKLGFYPNLDLDVGYLYIQSFKKNLVSNLTFKECKEIYLKDEYWDDIDTCSVRNNSLTEETGCGLIYQSYYDWKHRMCFKDVS